MGMVTLAELSTAMSDQSAFRLDQATTDRAQSAIDDASAFVMALCGRTTWANPPAAVKGIVKRIAADLFTNYLRRASYNGPDGMSWQGALTKMLSDDDKAVLDQYTARRKHVGMIRMSAAPWSVPEVD